LRSSLGALGTIKGHELPQVHHRKSHLEKREGERGRDMLRQRQKRGGEGKAERIRDREIYGKEGEKKVGDRQTDTERKGAR
jgi:hypothetical protein